MHNGFVSLVGAGCGDPGLLTLRGRERLAECTALVYDDLIDPAVLEFAPPQAARFHMGKRSGQHSTAQEAISAKLVELARGGHRVVRLKGGDPFVFGRGGEEILALQAAGILFEVVPGISSAIAIPAAAGIPVTHRGISRSFHVITGHTAGDGLPDLAPLARLRGTLVFLMGLSRLSAIASGLMAEGMAPSTPAAVVSGGNAPNPICVRATLADIAEQAAGVSPPAVIVVGETAALDLTAPALRPLEGLRVGVTGTAALRDKLLPALRERGAQATSLAATRVRELPYSPDCDALCSPAPHWVVFTSANGVDLFFRRLAREMIDLRRLGGCRFAVIGPATGAALARHGVFADLQPQTYTSEGLARALVQCALPTQPVLLFRSAQGAAILPQTLCEHGFSVTDLPVYGLEPVPDVPGTADRLAGLDWITFASAGGVAEFFRRYTLPAGVRCACIGPVTARALARYWSGTPVVAEEATADALVRTIVQHSRP